MDAASARQAAPTRKKVRRGTRSCWECKRRKMKCVFDRPDDAVCMGCHRRWTKCVSQEFPEEVSAPLDSNRQLRDRLQHVESRLDQLFRLTPKTTADGRSPDQRVSTPASTDEPRQDRLASREPEAGGEAAAADADADADADALSLSQVLYAALPSRPDTARICQASAHHSVPFHEILTTSYAILERDGLRSQNQNRLLEIPGPTVHPVLIARHMLHLASFLQHLHPDRHEEIRGLSEPPQILRERLADLAIRQITARDRFVGSIEFLECIMIESLSHANAGSLRRSWLTARRAMAIAQSMGFHRSSGGRCQYQVLHPETTADPHFMWFRIVFYDRQLCLMLGMPQGTLDRSMASDAMLAQDSPAGRLERIHCVVASRILERNESDPACDDDYAWAQNLDRELQRSARTVPSRWWLIPNLSAEKNDSPAVFWEMRRLSAQLFYYNLLNQLHLPYMLRDSAQREYDYSRITCINASREILSRFIMLRRWNRVAFSCRTIDFTALMAAMTLLLALLDRHRASRVDHFLAAPGDRAMIEQAQENMEDLNRLNADPLSARSAWLLRRLLAIEAQAAEGDLQSAQSVSVQASEAEEPPSDDSAHPGQPIYIPYFGVIKAAGEGHPDEMSLQAPHPPPANDRQSPTPAIMQAGPEAETQTQPVALGAPSSSPAPRNNNVTALFAPLFSEVLSDDPMHQVECSGLVSGMEDGAFQDVDLAFLDNLMRGAGGDGKGGAEWPAV